MDSFHMILLGIFAVVAYFILTDEGVAAAFFYVTRLVKAYIQRQLWWLTHNPRNPVVKYMMWRRSMKLAQELMDEYKNK